ncbi:hypothetical protein N431DRAFT_429888 [Stipitochalara longipes BDJ]|nr:hypothetical protein N431DRAFT_429888 [Stipitochalara longipes BDJ]
MGLNFQSSFNETLASDLKLLVPKLKNLQQGLTTLKSIERQPINVELAQSQLNHRVAVLISYSRDIQVRTEDVLEKLYDSVLSDAEISTTENQRLEAVDPPRQFCDGAKHFQAGEKTDRHLFNIAAESFSSSTWGYICQSCGLEVGLYPAIRLSSDQKALHSSTLLTASHLIAFKSFKERRAFYRCLPCYKERKIVDFPSAVSFEKHMKEHPDFTMMKRQDELARLKDIEIRQNTFMAGIEAATEDPEGIENINFEEKHIQDTKIETLEASDRRKHFKLGMNGKEARQKEEDNTALGPSEDFAYESRHSESMGRDRGLEIRRKELNKNTTSSELSETMQSKKLVHELNQNMPGAFPFGTLGSTTPTSTISSVLDTIEADVARKNPNSPANSPNATGQEPVPNSDISPTRSTAEDSRFLIIGDLDEESADLPIGLVERASEPRSGVMSPAPADPLARLPLPEVPRRPIANKNSGEYNCPLPLRTTGSKTLQTTQGRSLENEPLEESEADTTSKRYQPSAQQTSAARSNRGGPPPSQQQDVQFSPPRREPPATPSNGQSPPRDKKENASQEIVSSAIDPIEKTLSRGTWEVMPNGKFTYFNAERKILKEQANAPLDEWIWSKLGWEGQAGMYWGMVQSRSKSVKYSAEDPR